MGLGGMTDYDKMREARLEYDRHDRTRRLLMTIRQSLIMILGALEDYLELARSIVPRRKRERGQGATQD